MTTYKGNIPVKNVFYMLYFASRVKELKLSDLPNLGKVSTEEFDDISDLFAAILSEGIGKQLKRGLYREYMDIVEDIPTVRGKIDMVGTIRNKIARRQLLSCEHDELSENTLSNRILKTTAMLLLRDKEVKEERKKTLRQEMRYFSNVDEIRNPTTIRWSQVRYHRNNRSYRVLIFICKLILQELLLTTEDGEHVLKTFANEKDKNNFMARIYEKFIFGYYKKELEGKQLTVKGDKDGGEIWWAGVNEPPKESILPKMRTDIMLSWRDEGQSRDRILIIDAKWYENILPGEKDQKGSEESPSEDDNRQEYTDDPDKEGRIRSGNIYQVLAYIQNKAKEKDKFGNKPLEVSGMLLYAGTEKGTKPNKSYNILGHRFDVKTLDLSKEFEGESGIKAQLDGIANDFISSKAGQ